MRILMIGAGGVGAAAAGIAARRDFFDTFVVADYDKAKAEAAVPDDRFRSEHVDASSADEVTALCREHGISSATFYKWRSKFGGMEVPDAKRLEALEGENARLKKLLAEAMLDNEALKVVVRGKG